jgi:hypothetical protein
MLYSATCFSGEVTIEGTSIKFNVPEEFGGLSQELIDVKWPNKNGPKWVIGNKRGTTTIAYDLKDNDISKYSMKDLIPAFDQTMSRMIPGIVWKEKKVISQSGRKWVYLEMTSNAIDTDIYNMMLLTSYENKMLIFNFNSTKEEIDKYKPVLVKSMKSINLGKKANK